MAGDVTEQTTRAEKWLAGQKWKLRESRDFRPQADIQVVERFLEDVPRELLRGLVAYLVATATETDPQIEGKPYFGTWTFSRHSWERESPPDDNRLTFVQTMVAGVGATAGYVVENGCSLVVTQTFYWDVAALPAVPAGTSGVEYRLAGISRDREDGLYSCVLEKREQVTQTIAQYVTEEGSAERTLEQVFLGVRTGDVDNAGVAVGLQSMTLEAGKIKSRRRRKNANCTQDVEEQDRRGVNQTAAGGEARWDQTSETAMATQADAEVAATPVAGKIVRARNRPTEFGKVATELETVTPINQTATGGEARWDQTSETATATQADAEVAATPVAGKIVRARNRPTEFGKVATELEVVTPVDQEATLGEDRHDQTSTRTTHTQADAAVTAPPTATAGTIARVQNRPTEFGKYATEAETITAKNQTATGGEARADQTSETATATQADAEVAATPVAGKIVRARNRPTEFGKVATELETVTPVNQTATAGETRADKTSATATATQADAEVSATPGVGEANKVVRARNRPTEFGKVATEREVVTPVPMAWTASVNTKRGRIDGVLTVWWWVNQASGYGAALLAAVADTNDKSLSARLNEFDLEDGTASAWASDDSGWTTDAFHAGLQTWTGQYDRVKDFVSGTTITTKKQVVSFNHYSQMCATHQDAENAAQLLSGMSEYGISLVTLKTGLKFWRMTGRSKPTAYGAWGDV